MNRLPRSAPRPLTCALLASAALATLATPVALAQDCTLKVHASPQVVYTGQSAGVNVLAYFPPTGYAFASAQFDVFATHPAWTFSTGGAIVGDDVLGINASQPHAPQLGVLANPANPYRVWHGAFTPTSSAPALVQITANPTGFSIYPSRLTSSSIPRDAEGGSDYILVNPLAVGKWVAAPGPGTEARAHDDVMIDGRIITGENPTSAILLGMLVPAVQAARESTARVEFDGIPETFRAAVQVERDGIPHESFALNWTRIDYSDESHMMGLCVEAPAGASMPFGAFNGGVYVAAGDLGPPSDEGDFTIEVASIPQRSLVRIGPGALTFSGAVTYTGLEWTLLYDQPVVAKVRSRGGHERWIEVDSIVIGPATRHIRLGEHLRSSNNLKQLGLGVHNFEATGVEGMRITPAQPR